MFTFSQKNIWKPKIKFNVWGKVWDCEIVSKALCRCRSNVRHHKNCLGICLTKKTTDTTTYRDMLIASWESERKEEMLYKFSAPSNETGTYEKKKDDMKIFRIKFRVAKQCICGGEQNFLFYLSRELSGSGIFFIFSISFASFSSPNHFLYLHTIHKVWLNKNFKDFFFSFISQNSIHI